MEHIRFRVPKKKVVIGGVSKAVADMEKNEELEAKKEHFRLDVDSHKRYPNSPFARYYGLLYRFAPFWFLTDFLFLSKLRAEVPL